MSLEIALEHSNRMFFYTADEKLCEYEKFFGEKSKSQDKLIQFEIPEQHKNQDCPSTKPEWLECLLN